MHCQAEYRGRFAPSPTGPLHFGSIVAALASYLDARAHGGTWLVRMEDLDKPREQPGAADGILHALSDLTLHSDLPVVRQSDRLHLYRAALEQLIRNGYAYGCGCTRRDAADCRCREGLKPGAQRRSWRMRAPQEPVCFHDRVWGRTCLTSDDFILMRADGFFAYQLAVVVDDAEQGITDVVRGADLLDSTPRQILLQRALGLAQPRYLHVPVATDELGMKLSKQNRAPAVDTGNGREVLRRALRFLGQDGERGETLEELLRCATGKWARERMQRTA